MLNDPTVSISFASRYHDLPSLNAIYDKVLILDAVKQSFVDHEGGRIVQSRPVHMCFENGDCHIKSGYVAGGDTFTVKIATGFYTNVRHGIPNANGLVLLCSQRTGQPLAFFDDQGMLTAWRTVAATVIAATVRRISGPFRVAIVGAGLQAQLAADWLPAFCDIASLRVWARDGAKAAEFAARSRAPVAVEPDLATLCRSANLIITATPASTPVIMADWVQPGTHIVALGADNPGKVEIDPLLFARCEKILTDDHAQCLDHGDFGAAVRAGTIAADRDLTIGNIVSTGGMLAMSAGGISIADLTGLAAQDDAVARLFYKHLTASPASSA